jgi:manganese/zinc/iron transport system substrate-binding protein
MLWAKRRIRVSLAAVIAILTALFILDIFAAGAHTGAASASGSLKLVATTTMLADLAGNIAGENITVTCLMGPGIDPHQYQASAGDVAKMQTADIILYNGLHLEGKLGEVFAALGKIGKKVVCAADGIAKTELLQVTENQEIFDPHIWFDVSLWKKAASHLAASLVEIDPEGREVYLRNLDVYLDKLDSLDAYIRERTAELDEGGRVLVTAHDAFRYFGMAYGFEVIGLQGISTDAEAGTSDVSRLAGYIVKHKIKAVFTESSVPVKTIEALLAGCGAAGFDAGIGGTLYSDSLGDENGDCETYIKTFKSNIDTIIDALT